MDATNNRFYRETAMTDKRVEIIGLCMENNRRFTPIDMELFRKLDNYKATIEDAKEVISADPVTEDVKRLVGKLDICIRQLKALTIPTDMHNWSIIDAAENELKKWSGE